MNFILNDYWERNHFVHWELIFLIHVATSGQYTSEHEHFDGNEQGDEEHDYDMENIKRKKKTGNMTVNHLEIHTLHGYILHY